MNFHPIRHNILQRLSAQSGINLVEAYQNNKLSDVIKRSKFFEEWYYYYDCKQMCSSLQKERPDINDNYITIDQLDNFERLQNYNPPSTGMNLEEVTSLTTKILTLFQYN